MHARRIALVVLAAVLVLGVLAGFESGGGLAHVAALYYHG